MADEHETLEAIRDLLLSIAEMQQLVATRLGQVREYLVPDDEDEK